MWGRMGRKAFFASLAVTLVLAACQGPPGPAGKDGAAGAPGKDGATGPAGKDGAAGKDAREIRMIFSETEADQCAADEVMVSVYCRDFSPPRAVSGGAVTCPNGGLVLACQQH